MNADTIHLVRVTTDDRAFQFWAAATSREQAVDSVLAVIPEGWCACLLDETLKRQVFALSNMAQGEVRELSGTQGLQSIEGVSRAL
jgi:hypothetical protein